MNLIGRLKKIQSSGRLVSGTSYSDYAINNKMVNDNNFFIEKKQGSAKFSFCFIYNGETYGVWIDYSVR